MNRPTNRPDSSPLVPQEPLFSLTALKFRAASVETAGAARFQLFWARNAIFHGLRALGILPGQKILVPAYLCATAIEPIEHFGAEVEYYAVRRNCIPDWADIESKIRGNVRAVLAVHYFGFPCDMEKFCALRDQYNIFLIEDCAHVLEGAANPHSLGEIGDFSVFSPRKHLSVFDGGILRLNRSAPGFHINFQSENLLFTLREVKNLLERRKPSTAPLLGTASVEAPTEAVRGEPESPSPHRLEKPRYVFPNGTSFLPWMADFPMSRLSKHLLPHFRLLEIASRRRANYDYLLQRVSRIKGVQPLFDRLDPGIVPWVLPLTIGDTPDAHIALRAIGIPAVTWGGVRHPRISSSEFPDADFLYEHLVFLPIHQGLETEDLDLIADAVAAMRRTG